MAKAAGSIPAESTRYNKRLLRRFARNDRKRRLMTVAGQNLKDQIRKLVELQIMDEEIFRFKRELREKPAELESLKVEFESKKVSLKVWKIN